MNQDLEQVIQLAVLIFAALATGALMVNWVGLGREMSRLSVWTYVEFHQATNHTFNPYMPIVVVGTIFGGIVLATKAIEREAFQDNAGAQCKGEHHDFSRNSGGSPIIVRRRFSH